MQRTNEKKKSGGCQNAHNFILAIIISPENQEFFKKVYRWQTESINQSVNLVWFCVEKALLPTFLQ